MVARLEANQDGRADVSRRIKNYPQITPITQIQKKQNYVRCLAENPGAQVRRLNGVFNSK
jgi:hypothetical protein